MHRRIWRFVVILMVVVNLLSAGSIGIRPALAAPQPAPLQALSFTPEVVDPNAMRGMYSSIAVDAAGVPHIAYHDSTNGDLLMASKHGGTWFSEVVDSTGITGITPSIALDEDGLAHIAYYDQTNGYLRYAKQRTPDGWNIQTVDSTGTVGKNVSLVLDSLQRPHVAYWDNSNHALKYGFFDGSTWQLTTIPGANDVWSDSSISMAVGNDNLPRIAYLRRVNTNAIIGLGYAWHNGTTWTVETAISSGFVGERFSLALDSSNIPHISFMDNSVGLRYTKKDPSWATPETVVGNILVGSLNNLALDPAGRVRIVYLDASALPNTVKYAYKDGVSWRFETLATTATSPDLAFGSDGSAHISYQNADNKQAYIPLAPLPDLQVADVWLKDNRIYFQLYNAGLGVAPAGHLMNLSVGGTPISPMPTITVSIPAGGRFESSFNKYTWGCTPGSNVPVSVTVDSLFNIAEISDSNNILEETWLCKGLKPEIIAGPTVSGVTQTTATITWTTSTNTDGTVNYGRKAGLLNGMVSNSGYQPIHIISLSSLTPGATYAFNVTSMDITGQTVSSGMSFFTMQPAGGSVSNLVTRSITKDDGPGEVYTLKASVPGATGLEKVEFFYQLTPTSPLVLIGTAFSGTPTGGGTVEYATKFSPGTTGLSRQKLDGAKIIVSVSIPGGSPQAFEDLFTPLNTPPPVVSITSPNPDTTIYVDSWPTAGKKLTVKAHAEAYEWDCEWSGTDTLPDCDTEKKPVDKVRLWIDGATPVEIFPAANQYDFEYEFTLPGTLPMDYKAYAQAFSGDGNTSTHVPAHIKIGTPIASLERAVTRVGNKFHVVLSIKNDAAASGSLFIDGLYDYVRGFQPIFDDTGDVKITSSYTPSSRVNQMYFDLDQGSDEIRTIPIGGSYSFNYDLIPVIYENDVQYAFGEVNVTSLVYKVGSDERYQYFNLPVSVVPDPTNISLANSVAKALKEDDYLLVTHPANLKSVYGSQTDEPNWNTLLRRLAELADLRQGALVYLDSQDAETLNKLLEPEYHTWADKLHSNYSKYAQGYVLLVGEDNIVPSYTKTGLEGGTVKLTDNPYAHTGGGGGPDLVLARLPGNDIPQLIAPIVTSLKVLRSELTNDRNKALISSGTGDGIGTFQETAETAKQNLTDDGWAVTLLHEEELARTKIPITIDFDEGDLLAAGDIDGDGDQELLIGDVSTDDIYVVFIDDQGYNRVKLFHYPEDIQSGHGFAVGDLDGDLKDELVIADDINRIFIYKCQSSPCNESHPPQIVAIHTQPFDNWDKLALGNMVLETSGGLRQEIILAHNGTVYKIDGMLGTVLGSFPMAFGSADDLAAGRIWDSDLVDEIVLMDASQKKGFIYSTNGTMHTQFPAVYSEGDFVIAADIDGNASDAKPEEVWVLNSAGNSIQGYHTFGSEPKAHYIPQRVNEGDKIAAIKLAGETRPAIWVVRRTDEVYPLDRDYPEYMRTRYRAAAEDADLLLYRGHGNAQSWESIDATINPGLDFKGSAPLAQGLTCLSGDYSVESSASQSERMLWWGAGAFYGSTETSSRVFNSAASDWITNHQKDIGPFARLWLRYKNFKFDAGDDILDMSWPYWVHEYNFYGDAKFGFIGDTTQLPAPDAAPRAAGPTALHVTVPPYVVTQLDSFDFIDIPGGDITSRVGALRIPYYEVIQEYPTGTRASGVTLSARGGKSTATGLKLPAFAIEIDSLPRPAPSAAPLPPSAPDEMDWTPAQDQVFTWKVIERADGSSQLVIRLNPFYYSPATTNVEFYTSYDFNIETTATKQEITRLRADKAIYRLNQPVTLDALIKNHSSSPVDLTASATLYKANGTAAAGADMRLLNGVAGGSSAGYSASILTTALPAGSYYAELVLREPTGSVVDTETVELELGMTSAQVELAATPKLVKPGNLVAIDLAVTNDGDQLLSGATAEVVVLNPSGVVVASFSQALSSMAAGAITHVPFSWNTTGATDWQYTLQGRVLYNSQSTPVDTTFVNTKLRIYLPVTVK